MYDLGLVNTTPQRRYISDVNNLSSLCMKLCNGYFLDYILIDRN